MLSIQHEILLTDVTIGPKKRAIVTIVSDDNMLRNITNVRKLMTYYVDKMTYGTETWFDQVCILPHCYKRGIRAILTDHIIDRWIRSKMFSLWWNISQFSKNILHWRKSLKLLIRSFLVDFTNQCNTDASSLIKVASKEDTTIVGNTVFSAVKVSLVLVSLAAIRSKISKYFLPDR